MRRVFFISLILFAFISSAQQGAREFVSDAAGQDETVSLVELPGRSAWSVAINDSLIMLIGENGSFRIATGREEVFPLLVDYQQLSGARLPEYPQKKELAEVMELVEKFNASREPRESKCLRESGFDRFPCFDRESCFKACYSPLCKPLALGIGWNFVDNLTRWVNSTRSLESNMSEFVSKFGLLAGEADAAELRERKNVSESALQVNQSLELVLGMGRAAGDVSANPIFSQYGYSFCNPIQFDWQSLLSARRALENFSARLAPLAELDMASGRIAEEGTAREKARFKNQWERACANFSASGKENLQSLESKIRDWRLDVGLGALGKARVFFENASQDCAKKDFEAAENSVSLFDSEIGAGLLAVQDAFEIKNGVSQRLAEDWARLGRLEQETGGLDGIDGVNETRARIARLGLNLEKRLNESALSEAEQEEQELRALMPGFEKKAEYRDAESRKQQSAAIAIGMGLVGGLLVYRLKPSNPADNTKHVGYNASD